MSIYSVLTHPNPILRQVASPVTVFDDRLATFVSDMFETMDHKRGIGLAAPQIGCLDRVIVIGYKKRRFVLINPVIEYFSKKQTVLEEGCLSLPGVLVDVLRPSSVTVKAYDLLGNLFTLKEKGMVAKIIQHELDHLNGVLIVDHGEPKILEEERDAHYRS